MAAPSPFAPLPHSVPVTVHLAGPLPRTDSTVVRLEPALHDHPAGQECAACAASTDVRALLFDLMTESRDAAIPLTHVVLDARALSDPQPVIDKLVRGRVPALGLRDHTVARSFHLA